MDIEALVRSYLVAGDAGDEEAVAALLDDDVVTHAPGGAVIRGVDATVVAGTLEHAVVNAAHRRRNADGAGKQRVQSREAFAGWHYKNDPTHVCFFSRETWQWWAARQGTVPEFVADDALLLRKPPLTT